MDFGIARALADTKATMTGGSTVLGTAHYLSPEQARGESVDARSDLYSAGVLLYELVKLSLFLLLIRQGKEQLCDLQNLVQIFELLTKPLNRQQIIQQVLPRSLKK